LTIIRELRRLSRGLSRVSIRQATTETTLTRRFIEGTQVEILNPDVLPKKTASKCDGFVKDSTRRCSSFKKA
jgi:hypothetical protein